MKISIAISIFIAAILGLIVVIAPILMVVLIAFSNNDVVQFPPNGFSLRWFAEFFATTSMREAFIFSLQLAGGAATIAAILATLAALRLVRARGIAASAVQMLLAAPLVFPTIILGLALLLFFRALHIGVLPGLLIAHITIGVPYAFRLIFAQLQGLDHSLEEAGQSLGAGWLRIFYQITLPLIWPGVLSGWLFAFIVSLGELNTALFLTTPQVKTLPIELFGYLQFQGNQLVVAAASTVQIALILVAMLFLESATRFGGRAIAKGAP